MPQMPESSWLNIFAMIWYEQDGQWLLAQPKLVIIILALIIFSYDYEYAPLSRTAIERTIQEFPYYLCWQAKK